MSLAAKIGALFGTSGTSVAGASPEQAGTIKMHAGANAPASWLLCYGQAISRTTYAVLFAEISTVFGSGDGSTTFNVPDLRGRVPSGKDDMGGTAAGVSAVTISAATRASTSNGVITALSATAGLSVGMKAIGSGIGAGALISSIDSATQVTLSVNNTATGTSAIRFGVIDGATLGDRGGSQVAQLTTAQIPAHNHTGSTASAGDHSHTGGAANGGNGGSLSPPAGATFVNTGTAGAHTHTLTIDNAGGGQAHSVTQPSIVMNFIIKT